MLIIKRTAPDRFTALDAEEVLGWCTFSLGARTLQIAEVFLADAEDLALLDGLLRAALFFGFDGGLRGRIGAQTAARYARELEALEIPCGRLLESGDLEKPCR